MVFLIGIKINFDWEDTAHMLEYLPCCGFFLFGKDPLSSSRSSCSQMFFKIDVLRNFEIFAGNTYVGVLIYVGFQAWNFIKKRLQQRCFPFNIAKFLKIAFFCGTLWWLPLFFYSICFDKWLFLFLKLGVVCIYFLTSLEPRVITFLVLAETRMLITKFILIIPISLIPFKDP